MAIMMIDDDDNDVRASKTDDDVSTAKSIVKHGLEDIEKIVNTLTDLLPLEDTLENQARSTMIKRIKG